MRKSIAGKMDIKENINFDKNKKAPGLPPEKRRIKTLHSLPPRPKPGTNKPLSTSFRLIKTIQFGNSYIFGKLGVWVKNKRFFSALAVIIAVGAGSLPSPSGLFGPGGNSLIAKAADSRINVWTPKDQEVLSGTRILKASLDNWSPQNYRMYWQVDNGQQNEMYDSYADAPHKEAWIDFSGWTWRNNGPYALAFSAYDRYGRKLAEAAEIIYVGSGPTMPISVSQPSASSASVSCPSPVTNAFMGCYYNDRNLGDLTLSRTDNSINFDWGGGSPDSRVPSDNFSARWQGNYSFNSGNYTFIVTADDGVRLYVDDQLIIDKWKDQPATTYTADRTLAAGSHLIKMEYYENGGGAVAKLSWKQTSDAVFSQPPSQQYQASVIPGNPFSGMKLYVNPDSNAAQQAAAWRSSRPQDAQMMDKIATQPNAVWIGSWNSDVRSDVNNLVSAAQRQGTMPVMIAYNIPNRDCGGYSAGGAQTADAYRQWIDLFAAGIGSRKAAIILEPDALTLTNCLSSSELQARYDMLKYAVAKFKSLGQTAVYLDAGHAKWLSADEVAGKLLNAGVSQANGFSLNISNFVSTADNEAYGRQVSAKIGGKHFVIDTSRNGLGPAPDMQWCNPPGRALGERPTSNTGDSLVDAFLWGKQPGESDGQCNGGPAAGVWWPEYALGLAQRAAW